MQPKVELARPRDFGEIINDTFAFIKQNFKNLLKNFFIFCGFFMVAAAGISFFQQYRVQQMVQSVTANTAPTFDGVSDLWVSGLVSALMAMLVYTTAMVTVLSYMAIYKQKGNEAPEPAEVWTFIKHYFLRTLLGGFVCALLLGIGFVLCVIPGLWLFPIFGLIFPIMIMENAGFGDAFSRSFTLIKDNWWVTAGAVLVLWIITYFMITFIMMPVSLLLGASLFFSRSATAALPLWGIILMSILQILAQLIAIIPIVGVALCFYNLTETKEGNSLMSKIENFGQHNAQTDLPSEEY